MKGKSSILLVFCVISGCLAKPPPTFLEYKDSLGQYSFGYSAPESARSEVRSIDGSTRGSYSYVDGLGNIQSAQYTADGENGFQIVATNLPQAPRPVEYTPEVAAARIDHLKAFETASKLAEEKPEEDGQRSAVNAGKSVDSIVNDNVAELGDKMEIRAQMKSASDPEANKMASEPQAKSVENPEAVARSDLTESQSAKTSDENVATAKSAAVENLGETTQVPNQPSQDGSGEAVQPQAKAAKVSSHSDVPVVTTSFVIPGRVNLHTRIQLDQSGGAAERIASESSPLFVAQPSLSQGANLYPSIVTPAGTTMATMAESKKNQPLGETSVLPSAPVISSKSVNQPQGYSNAIVPGAVAPPNVFAFTYGIGIDPIYHQYNPYQYFPYGVL